MSDYFFGYEHSGLPMRGVRVLPTGEMRLITYEYILWGGRTPRAERSRIRDRGPLPAELRPGAVSAIAAGPHGESVANWFLGSYADDLDSGVQVEEAVQRLRVTMRRDDEASRLIARAKDGDSFPVFCRHNPTYTGVVVGEATFGGRANEVSVQWSTTGQTENYPASLLDVAQ